MRTVRPQLVIFDCDGVLVDSEVIACRVHSDLLREYGFEISAEEVARRFVGVSAVEMRVRLEELFGRPLPADHESRCAAELEHRFRATLRPILGVADVLENALACGYRICIASGSSPARIALSLEVSGLQRYFGDRVFSTSMVAHGKPAPDVFLHAAAEMGFVPEECLVVEDSVLGVRAACAAGMPVVGLCAASHCGPGYGDQLSAAGAMMVAESAADVADVLLALGGDSGEAVCAEN